MDNRNKPAQPGEVAIDRKTGQMVSRQIDNDAFIEPGLTKLETLAMQIYVVGIRMGNGNGSGDPDLAMEAIRKANVFFDQLEKGNE